MLEDLFNDIKRIANAMEKRNEILQKIADRDEKLHINSSKIIDEIEKQVTEPTFQPVTQPEPAPVQPVKPVIPVSQTIQTYTQEQLAQAMGRAVDMGKMSDIQNIIAGFGVHSLMELPTERYGELVLKLKEIGVEV